MADTTQQEFGKLRATLWPVHNFELKKLLPMFLMFFCISFNYTILRDTKDTLVVTSSGAETIPFLKVWCVVPAALIFMIIFSKLSNIFSREKLFYVTLTPFLIFFAVFALFIYPNREFLHPTTSADALAAALPQGFAGFIAIYRNWSYSLFYVLAELWGSVALSLLFWGFANDITRISEAKRFYHLFGLGANLALLFSGPYIFLVTNIRKGLPADVDAWEISLYYLMGMLVVLGIVILLTYRWITKNVLTDPQFYDTKDIKKKTAKPKMSMGESLKYLLSSKYILCLAMLVICYGIAINVVEVTWKSQLKLQYPDPNDYGSFMGIFSFFTGLATIFMILIVSRPCIRRGWGFAALVTPTILAITGIAFFAFVIFKQDLSTSLSALGTTPLWLAVLFGAMQNIMSKSAKYSLFDPTKEMAYIPLDAEQKTKGKAAIDVVGARLGKSGGSLIQQGLILSFGSLAAVTPHLGIILLVIIGAWFVSAKSLNSQFTELTKNPKDGDKKANATTA